MDLEAAATIPAGAPESDIYDIYESFDEATLGFHLANAASGTDSAAPTHGLRPLPPVAKMRKATNGNQFVKARYAPSHRVRAKAEV